MEKSHARCTNIKILFVGNGLLNTDNYPIPNVGGSVQTWGLSQELVKRGHEVFIVRRNVREGEEKIENVNLVSIKFKGMENLVYNTWSLSFHIARTFSSLYFSTKSLGSIQRINPDVICLIDRFSGIFPARLDIPKIYIMHVPEALDFFRPYAIHANKLNSIVFYIKKSMENSIISKVDRIVSLNNYIKKYLRRRGFCNVVKIPNGIDTKEFSDKGDRKFVLYAGKFDWNKNVCSLIEAFAELQASYDDYHLYIVGKGPEERRIRHLVKEKALQSRVIISQWLPRKKLINIMSKCSVFVLPSFFEAANPVVVLEAMASGKPVIARTNMGTVDVITHGKNGYLYNNEEELRRYLELLLSDKELRKKMGRDARKAVEQKYTFSKIADSYEELYESLALRQRFA